MADIGDIHDTVDVVAFIAECLFQDILHNITAQVSDVRKMINGRSAGVHFYTARCVCQKFSFFMGCRIIKIHKRSLLFSFRADTDAEVMIHKKAKKQKSVCCIRQGYQRRRVRCLFSVYCTGSLLKLILAGFFFDVNSPETVEDKK